VKARLSDYAGDVTSQFGEDQIIAFIFEQIGMQSKVCVEFGAGDGMSCANTVSLWRDQGWKALLIEPDPERFEALEGNARLFAATCLQAFVTPQGPGSISSVLESQGITAVDFLSIDVDGDDYFILANLAARPRVICIEANPTIPPHLDVHQEPGGTFGASFLSLIRLGEQLGYRFVGNTYCNAFFVLAEEAGPFASYETDPEVLFSFNNYTYAATDFAGRVVLLGQVPPWGVRDPYVQPLVASTYVTPVTDSAQHLRRGFESLWGPAWWLTPDGLPPERLAELLAGVAPALVCIDLSGANPETTAWMQNTATEHGYRTLLVGPVLGLIKETP
jgi:hypothetical protein